MSGTWRKMAAAFTILAVLVGTAVVAAAEIKIQNTSKYAGAGRWDWTIFVDADAATLRSINCVEYTLHPTFPDPIRKVCGRPETKFELSSNGWGTFTVKVNVEYKDGHLETIDYPLMFERTQVTAPSSLSAKNWSRQIEPGWWDWGIHIEGPSAELDRIRCVEYTLHPSFPNHVRLVCTRQNSFELTTRGWGTFNVLIKVIFKDGSIRQMSHQLQFQQS